MLLRHSAIYLFARGIPGIVGFATVVIYTRLLSPEGYGQYALVVTTSILVNAVLYQWLNSSLLRFLPRYQNNQGQLLSTLFSGFVGISLVTGLAGLALALVKDSAEWNRLIVFSVLLIWVQAWFTLNLELSRSRLLPVRYGLIASLKAAIALGLGTALVLLQFDTHGALIGLIVGYIVAGYWAARGQWRPVAQIGFDGKLVRSVLAYGLPLTASYALNAVINSTDRFMLAAMVNESATGLYVAAQGLAQQSVGVLMLMVNLAAYPLAIRALEQNGADDARVQLRKNALLLLGLGLPITSVFVLCAPELSRMFLGQQFQEAGTTLMPWMALAALISGMRAYYFDLAFHLGQRTNIHVLVMVTAALVNVVLNLWLIPLHGLIGAAYASVAAFGIALVLSAVLGRRAFQLPSISGDVAKLFLATLVMAAVLFAFTRGDSIGAFLLALVIAGLTYGACVLAMNTGGAREITMNTLRQRQYRYRIERHRTT